MARSVAPPLAGSAWVTGNAEIPIRIVLRGLQGPITVKGQRFNSVMPGWASLSDADIAAAVTYIRASWGNRAPAVTPAQVAASRAATARQSRPYTAPELEALRTR